MKKTIKIEILIEQEFQTGFRAEFTISDMIFTEYSHLLSYEHIEDCYKKAMKKTNGFTMLTATLFIHDSNIFYPLPIHKSFRYVNRYGEVKKSLFNGNSYDNWQDESAKNILSDIKELVNLGNREFIELIKSN
jgi:hypothetical protein